jgi:hypothetical protein
LRKVLADFNRKRDESPVNQQQLQRDTSSIGLQYSKLNPNSSQQSMIAQSRASLMVDDGLVIAAENNFLRQ